MGPQLFLDTNYDFFSKRWVFVGISAAFLGASALSIATRGFNFGVEFTGGAQIEANFDESKKTKEPVTIENVRKAIDAVGLSGAQVVTVGAAQEHAFLIRVQTLAKGGAELGNSMRKALLDKYGEDKVTYWAFDEEARDSATARIEDPTVTPEAVKALLEGAAGLGGLRVDEVRTDKATGMLTIVLENAGRDVIAGLDAHFGPETYEASVDAIGAAVSKDLRQKGFAAIALACLLIAVYVWLRFDVEFAPGVIVALLHDVVVVMGAWSMLGLEFNLTFVAALLAILGYSVNDTVVIYDRIRENLHKHQSKDMHWVINKSVNETLSRTLLTSFATLLSVVAIALLGSESIRWFGVAMIIGLISGTYSTIGIATPITFWTYAFKERQKRMAAATPARQS